ncbi:hypothetical protein [Ectopseudomonas mendocina]|uniref:hypothetical protein n=1 Tax=Ectopseudomonas mendocina TaxID=300 RepID=UPI0005AA20FF|nr:hypothetical protein [Pseudomonas mendocina]VEE14542.1 Uncharacterised protein [Pseudomonas mendocina]
MIEQLTELCKDKFKGELDEALTLANILCWFFFVVSWHIFYTLEETNLIDGLSKVKINDAIDFSSGIFSTFSILELFASFIFVFVLSWLAKEMSEGLFFLFSLRDDFDSHMIESNKILLQLKQKSPLAMFFLGKDAEAKLSQKRAAYSRKRTTSQIILGAAFSTMLGLNFTLPNLALFIFLFLFFVAYTWRGFYFYIENILPYHVAQKYSSGGFASFEDGIEAD